jgi:hypothetical protein
VVEIAEAHGLMLEIVAEVEREARLRRLDRESALEAARRELELQSAGMSPFARLELLRDSAVEARVGALGARTLALLESVAKGRVAPPDVRQKARVLSAELRSLERQARRRALDLEAELADVEVELRFLVEGGAPARRMR